MLNVGLSHSRLRTLLTRSFAACFFAASLSACIVTADQSVESDPNDPRAQSVADRIRGLDLSPRSTRPQPVGGVNAAQSAKPSLYLNEGEHNTAAVNEARANGEGFDLNFENAPVTTVAKVILGDILGAGYTIDPRVQGTVTLASGRPISKTDAMFVLENALRMSNVSLIRDRNHAYRIVPTTEAVGSGTVDRNAATPGYGLTVVPLRYVSAQTVFKLLDAFGVKANSVRADPVRNILLIQGTGAERSAAMDTVINFDTDWMKGQSVGIFPIQNSSPEPLIAELEKIMDSGDGGLGQGVVKFTPVSRMNAILVVSQKPDYVKRAGTWISRLDRSDTAGTNLRVYPLRYGNAKQVTALLTEIITGRAGGGGGGNLDSAAGQIAPGGGMSASSSSSGGFGGSGSGFSSGSGLGSSTGSSSTMGRLGMNTNSNSSGSSFGQGGLESGQSGGARNPSLASQAGGRGGSGTDSGGLGSFSSGANGNANAALQNVRITADIANNSILVYANQEAHRIVEQTLRQIDRPQRQVAIEATIAEVTLNDNLSYGVQFYLTNKNLGLKTEGSIVNTLGNAALSRVLPGFNLLVGPEDTPQVVLDALHGITDVKVLSNPSVVVLDNQVATLQVGDQVPIATGSATVLTGTNSVVNTYDYRNTGIILRVLPRANANGNVVLDIEQEISNVVNNSSSSSNSSNTTPNLTPTISQRRVKSSISVTSGQTVVLAGLISDQENKVRGGIPLLDQLPGVVGDAFSHQNITKRRTELVLFIRPTVVRDQFDASIVAEELRSKMSGRFIGSNIPTPVLPADNVRR